MSDNAFEVNFDGLVGPTHNYSGLSYGNIASTENKLSISNPKEAALQGLEKMKLLADMGIKQGVLPPHTRPHIPTLRSLGFSGSDRDILTAAAKQAPELLLAVSSAAAMWTANAATISPSGDTQDNKVHLTPANLSSKFHRSIECSTTAKILQSIFKDERYFVHHTPLPAGTYFSDEGAANHTRLCMEHGSPGIELFTYGRSAFHELPTAGQFPARQTLEASQAIARRHGLDPLRTIFVQQNPKAIDAGAFHNDVVGVGNGNILFFHEHAFLDKRSVVQEIRDKGEAIGLRPIFLEVADADVSLKEAITSYLFNSQLISSDDGKMVLIAPIECQENKNIKSYIDAMLDSPANPITRAVYLNLRQSMRNGGGPACLRLRVVLTPREFQAVNPSFILDEELYSKLKAWINKHYRDRLHPDDLQDPQLWDESARALEELKALNKLR